MTRFKISMSCFVGSVIRVFAEDNMFAGVYFQDSVMRRMYYTYPEVLILDVTYGLNNPHLPLYILCTIGGNNETNIVALFLTNKQSDSSLYACMQLFKDVNTAWAETKVIITNYSLRERDVLEQLFPTARMQLSMSHLISVFDEEMSRSKYGLPEYMKKRLVELIEEMGKADTEEIFETLQEELMAYQHMPVIEYVQGELLPLRDQWVKAYKDTTFNLGEQTINRIDVLVAKINSETPKFSTIDNFFQVVIKFLESYRNEKRHGIIISNLRISFASHASSDDQWFYYNLLTPYAYSIVEHELNQLGGLSSDALSYLTIGDSACSCVLWATKNLPCAHMFLLRSLEKLSLCDETLVHKRWMKSTYYEVHDVNENSLLPVTEENEKIREKKKEKKKEAVKELNSMQKYLKVQGVGKKMAEYLSKCDMESSQRSVRYWSTCYNPGRLRILFLVSDL